MGSKKDQTQVIKQQFFSVSPNYTCWFQRTIAGGSGSRFSLNGIDNKHKGFMSSAAAKRIKHVFNWLIASSNVKEVFQSRTGKTFYFKLNFITLTLSTTQSHPDEYCKAKMLIPFIQWMQRRHGVKSYVWKAETQSNGNIHFHITTNKFIHWREVRSKWNSIQWEHGYRKGTDKEAFCYSTNSTDIKAVKSEKEIVMYMVKYFTKKDDKRNYVTLYCDADKNLHDGTYSDIYCDLEGLVWERKRKIEGRIWAASSNLISKPILLSEGEEAFNEWHKFLPYIQTNEAIYKDFVSIFPTRQPGVKELPKEYAQLRKNIIATINGNEKQQKFYFDESKE